MSKLSFIDKLGILINEIKASKIYLIVLIVLLVLGILILTTNKKNEKRHKIIYSVVAIIILVFIYISFGESLGNLINYMMNNFFIVVLFPNIAVYLAAIIATNIIVWISIFSFKSSKSIKILNTTIYIIMNFILSLVLNVIKTEKLDVFSQTAIYDNKTTSALISLSSTIFIVWIIFLVIYKIFLIYLRKDYKPKVKKIIVKRKVKMLPENFVPKEIPIQVYGKAPNKAFKQSTDEVLRKQIEGMLTLEDYKLLLKMLSEQKQKENEKSKEIKEEKVQENIPVIVEEKEIEKENREENQKVESDQTELQKYNELLEMYKLN